MVTASLCPRLQAGSHVREDLVPGIIAMISEAEELHAYSVQRLFVALRGNIDPVSTAMFCAIMLYIQCLCCFPATNVSSGCVECW